MTLICIISTMHSLIDWQCSEYTQVSRIDQGFQFGGGTGGAQKSRCGEVSSSTRGIEIYWRSFQHTVTPSGKLRAKKMTKMLQDY